MKKWWKRKWSKDHDTKVRMELVNEILLRMECDCNRSKAAVFGGNTKYETCEHCIRRRGHPCEMRKEIVETWEKIEHEKL